MKKNMHRAFFAIVMSTLLFSACANDVDSMVENYNGNFSSEKAVIKGPSILDADFQEGSMLDLKYTVSYDSTLCLTAPSDGVKYEWTATLIESAPGVVVPSATVTLSTSQSFQLFIRNSDLQPWCVYRLTLTVTGEDLKTYTDAARLIVTSAL